jgi:predicted nucleotidyltransferase
MDELGSLDQQYGDSIMNEEELLEQVRLAVYGMEPDAEIILYGSRSRGDSVPTSDWDFLVLVDGPLNDERIDRIRHRLYEIEWESGEVISSIVRNREQWNSDLYRAMPFHQRVAEEGIKL